MEKYSLLIITILTLMAAVFLALNLTYPYILTIWVGWCLFLKYGRLFSKK